MLEIRKIPNYRDEKIYDYEIIQEDKKMTIIYGGNLDLCFQAEECENQIITFEIAKEDSGIYELFDKLYNDCFGCNIYRVDSDKLERCDSEEEKQEYIDEIEQWNNELKNNSLYRKKLFKNGYLSWLDDDQQEEFANALNIYQEEGKYIIEFIFRDKSMINGVPVRIRNSGSRYQPFDIPFMRLYSSLQTLEIEQKTYIKK